MEDNKTYFGEIGHGLKTLAVGMKTSWKEYFKDFFTNKSKSSSRARFLQNMFCYLPLLYLI